MASPEPDPNLYALFDHFAEQFPLEIPQFEVVPGEQLPQPFRDLLVHKQHMTVTLEQFYGRAVELRVLAERKLGDDYARMILLSLAGTDQIVEFGIFRMDLSCCSDEVREAILTRRSPLGRILIEHDVLRHISPLAFLRLKPTPAMRTWFDLAHEEPVYGRVATIYCNDLPAIELLEIVRG